MHFSPAAADQNHVCVFNGSLAQRPPPPQCNRSPACPPRLRRFAKAFNFNRLTAAVSEAKGARPTPAAAAAAAAAAATATATATAATAASSKEGAERPVVARLNGSAMSQQPAGTESVGVPVQQLAAADGVAELRAHVDSRFDELSTAVASLAAQFGANSAARALEDEAIATVRAQRSLRSPCCLTSIASPRECRRSTALVIVCVWVWVCVCVPVFSFVYDAFHLLKAPLRFQVVASSIASGEPAAVHIDEATLPPPLGGALGGSLPPPGSRGFPLRPRNSAKAGTDYDLD